MPRIALVACAAHLALPAVLTTVARRSRSIGARADVVYDAGTVALALAAAAARHECGIRTHQRSGRHISGRRWGRSRSESLTSRPNGCGIRADDRYGRHIRRGGGVRRGVAALMAALAGAVLPTVVRSLTEPGPNGRQALRPASAPRRPTRSTVDAARIATCATAEEVLWRDAAPSGLRSIGVPDGWATVLAGAGFAGLHTRGGARGATYHVLTGALFTAAHAAGGPVASAACHVAHNLALAMGQSRTKGQEPAPVTAPPSRRDW